MRNRVGVVTVIVAGLVFAAGAVEAQTFSEPHVSNVRAAVYGGLVEISYDLEQAEGEVCPVSVKFSKDGGATFPFAVVSGIGDIGNSVDPGTDKKIIWNAYADYPDEIIEQAVVSVSSSVAGIVRTFAGIEFVYCPPGTFQMGRYPGEQDSYSDEDPQHSVTLTQGFWMSKYEVTQAQWVAVMGSNPSYFTGDTSCPVEQVSWNMIAGSGGFLDTLNMANPGMDFRLPTEAEWEYACRAGTTARFYWGDDPEYSLIGGYAWYDGNNDPYGTKPVGGKLPNAWGLYDMSGNVYEWVNDWYGSYSADPVSDPQGPSTGDYRVLRSGSWNVNYPSCRSANRTYYSPDNTYFYYGFRVAWTP